MHWSAAAAFAAIVLAFSSVGASADCADTWDGRTIEASGQIHDLGRWDEGWWAEVKLKTRDGCMADEIWAAGPTPPACRVGGHFQVRGRVEYDEDDENDFWAYMEDLLVIHASSMTCR